MKFIKTILIVYLIILTQAFLNTSPLRAEEKLLKAAVAVDTETKPASSFTADVPKLYAFYIGLALKEGDKIRGVWMADDVGSAAPKNTKIDEATIIAKTATDSGAFSLSRPTTGWPLGSYKIEIYVGDKLAETVKFKITEAEESDSDEEESEEEDE